MSKILKNITVSDIEISDTGITLAASSSYTLTHQEYLLWAASVDIITNINTGDVVVNDGYNDLSIADGKSFIGYPDTALGQRFLSEPDRSNGFTARTTQEAIEQGRTSGIGTVLPYPFISNGNSSNKWLGTYEASHFSNENPLVLPQNSDLKGMTFMSIDNDVDIDIEVYCNGTLAKTFEIRNKRFAYIVGVSPPVTMLQGDRVSVYLKKYTGGTGDQTPQDPTVTLLMKIVAETGADSGQQTGVI